MAKTAENGLIDDLIVTGCHAILVDKLTPNELLLNKTYNRKTLKIDDKICLLPGMSSQFEQLMDTNKYTYYHLALENDGEDRLYGIWANGILSETTYQSHFLNHNFDQS